MFLSDVTSHCQMLLNAKHVTEFTEGIDRCMGGCLVALACVNFELPPKETHLGGNAEHWLHLSDFWLILCHGEYLIVLLILFVCHAVMHFDSLLQCACRETIFPNLVTPLI